MPREIKDKVILTDCDGVLLDWEFHFYRWLEKTEGLHRLSDDYNVGKAVGVAQKTGAKYVIRRNEKAITTS
jgi:FMN phosphatase YigB (HAD superfamily)